MFSNPIGPSTARLIFFALLGTSAVVPPTNAADCKAVSGTLEETAVTGTSCTSSVGLCTVAQMFGSFKGQARFTATAILPSADTPTTNVVFVTGDTVITDAKLGTRLGTLLVKNAAAFRTSGEGDLSDTQVILGGTGDFVGATGSFRVSGTFLISSGTGTRSEEHTS